MVNLALVLPNSLALAATIQLHWIVALEHDHLAPSYQRCMDAATDMMSIIRGMADFDLSFLELHTGVSFHATALHLAPDLTFSLGMLEVGSRSGISRDHSFETGGRFEHLGDMAS